jgi:membrane fusion protein (multidrug efflux system)
MLKLNPKLCFIFVVLLAGSLLTGCKEQAPKASAAPAPVEVDIITLKPQPVNLEAELPGRTTAFRVAEVRPQVNGIVKKRLFTEGNEVKAGEVLYQIDPATYQAKFNSAEATLAKARAVEHSAKLKAERYRNLVHTKAVSELDQVAIEADWKQAVADVAYSEASLSSTRIDLEYTRVTAPISGRIGKSMISEGALVTAQQSTPLAIIQQLDPLYVDVTQSSTELLRLKKDLTAELSGNDQKLDSKVTILLEDGSEYEKPGSLEFSDVTVDQSTGTVTLRAIVANPDEELLPGMFVRARISTGIRQDAILVPAASISRNSKGQAIVMLVNGESTVESRIIREGQNVGDKVLVNEGLVAGEQLIVAGLQKIKPGSVVKGVEQESSLSGQIALKPKSSATVMQAE